MTSTGVKPTKKKIEAALKMGQPQNQSQVWSILRRVYVLSNIIAPTVVWTDRHTKSFSESKLINRIDEYVSCSQAPKDTRDNSPEQQVCNKMCLKEYRSMLLGGRINIYTNHKKF